MLLLKWVETPGILSNPFKTRGTDAESFDYIELTGEISIPRFIN